MDRRQARELAHALRDQLWSSSSNELLARLADRGGISIGLNPPDERDDEEFAEIVWRALRSIGLAEGE